jgi:NAD(P)-dependent dehydrogenase (short-subunit alcohol dehydrogenase family)
MFCRDVRKGALATEEIKARTGNPNLELIQCDLSSLASVRQAARQFQERYKGLDALVHNAAVYKKERSLTPDGFETMFATNHLGPFLLTLLLMESLRQSGGRVLSVTAPTSTPVNFETIARAEGKFASLSAFGASKMCNHLFAYALARRLEGSRATSNAFFPGLVRSELMTDMPKVAQWALWLLSKPPERAGSALATVAAAPEFEEDIGKCYKGTGLMSPPTFSVNEETQEALWQMSERLIGGK